MRTPPLIYILPPPLGYPLPRMFNPVCIYTWQVCFVFQFDVGSNGFSRVSSKAVGGLPDVERQTSEETDDLGCFEKSI